MQMPCGIELGGQSFVQAIDLQFRHDALVDHTGGMDDRPQRGLLRNAVDQLCQLVPVSHVTSCDLNACAQLGEFRMELLGSRRSHALTTREQQVAHTVLGDQVAGYECAEITRATGDQCHTVRIKQGGARAPVQGRRRHHASRRHRRKSGRQHHPFTHRQLRLMGGHCDNGSEHTPR